MYRLKFDHPVYEAKYRQVHPGVLDDAEFDGIGYLLEAAPPTDLMGAVAQVEEIES